MLETEYPYEFPALTAANVDNAEDFAEMLLLDSGTSIDSWKSYEFSTNYTEACSGWSFELADESYAKLLDLGVSVQNGARVALKINGAIQCIGYVDQIMLKSTEGGGTTMTLVGRDALSPAIDSHIAPTKTFDGLTTLGDMIRSVFKDFGFAISVDDRLNRTKLATTVTTKTNNTETIDPSTNQKIFTPGKIVTVNVPINSKFKPQHSEGVYEFAERIAKRFGFHLFLSVDAKTLYASQPDFAQSPIYALQHHRVDNTANNILSSSAVFDWHEQPSVIVVEGSGGGGHKNKKAIRCLQVNELLSDFDNQLPLLTQLKKDFKEAKVLKRNPHLKRPSQVKVVTKFAKPFYLHDDESKTHAQLENYTRRIMAEYQSKFFTATFTVNRHSHNGVIWTPNTIVWVDDESINYVGPLWIKARKFNKSVAGGTTTEITCILPYTFNLYPYE